MLNIILTLLSKVFNSFLFHYVFSVLWSRNSGHSIPLALPQDGWLPNFKLGIDVAHQQESDFSIRNPEAIHYAIDMFKLGIHVSHLWSIVHCNITFIDLGCDTVYTSWMYKTLIITLFCYNTAILWNPKISVIMRFKCTYMINVLVVQIFGQGIGENLRLAAILGINNKPEYWIYLSDYKLLFMPDCTRSLRL